MADENDQLRNNQNYNGDEAFQAESSDLPLELDLGDDSSRNTNAHRVVFQHAGVSSGELPKREDNPFSFKHFLQNDSGSYQNKGARPKVYCEGRPVTSVSDLELVRHECKQTRIVPEYSSGLPDFVQDHLVVEQCYLGNPKNNHFNIDNNLPDFTPSRDSVNINRLKVDSSHSSRPSNDLGSIPLDLPLRTQAGFPLDLPITNSLPTDGRNSQSNAEVGVSKSLPDFLADGAVRSQSNDSVQMESPERESERMRRELEVLRAHLSEQTRRAEAFSRELENSRSKGHSYTHNLSEALDQLKENLERSNMRAATAENTVVKLRHEIKSLTAQLESLRFENRALREGEVAAGGSAPNELHSQRLAQELRAAASTAEQSLMQLLTGVDNLRLMAASLESLHRVEEKRESLLDLEDDSGPAL